jgi:hypothetical protein
MNTLILLTAAIAGHTVRDLLIGFLLLVLVLAIIAGVIWCIERWIHPLPPPVKLVLAIILVILVILWAISAIGW